MTEQEKAQDDVIECALFSNLHAFYTLFVLSLCCHSVLSYVVILSVAKNLRLHHSTCSIRKALRFYRHSKGSEESQCLVRICRSLTIQKVYRFLSSSCIQLDAAQEQVR